MATRQAELKIAIEQKTQHLPQNQRRLLIDFTTDLLDAFADNLVCVLLFGSAARVSQNGLAHDFKEGTSDLNTAVILSRVRVAELAAIVNIGRKFRKQPLALPLVLPADHIPTSLDTFPLEFADMQQHHICLYGTDPLEKATIQKTHLRHQCEYELKGMLIRLRRAFLATAGDSRKLHQILTASIASLLAACRGIIRLAGNQPPVDTESLMALVAQEYQVNTAPIEEVWQLKRGDKTMATAALELLFDNYLETIKNLAMTIDRLEAR